MTPHKQQVDALVKALAKKVYNDRLFNIYGDSPQGLLDIEKIIKQQLPIAYWLTCEGLLRQMKLALTSLQIQTPDCKEFADVVYVESLTVLKALDNWWKEKEIK